MADWDNPTLVTAYATFLDEMKARDLDAATMFSSAPTHPVANMIRYNRGTNIFEQYNGAVWVALVLAAAGGGTGGTTAIGTMAYQNSNAIAVTGGTISGLSAFSVAAHILFDADGTRNLGANAQKANNVYIKNGLLVPVGTDKWVVS
jgi:hypothetical protein